MIGAACKGPKPPVPVTEHRGVTYLLEFASLARDARGNAFPLPCATCGTFSRLQIFRGIQRLKCIHCSVVSLVEVSPVRDGWRIRCAPAAAA
jgi:hypothetical protein